MFHGDCGSTLFRLELTSFDLIILGVGIGLICRCIHPCAQASLNSETNDVKSTELRGDGSYRALTLSWALRILKSSIVLPAFSADTNHSGCLPRPDQVSDGTAGF